MYILQAQCLDSNIFFLSLWQIMQKVTGLFLLSEKKSSIIDK